VATHEIRIDRSKTLLEEPNTGHNRWHPDIPPLVRCEPGDEVVLETRDAFDGQMSPDATLVVTGCWAQTSPNESWARRSEPLGASPPDERTTFPMFAGSRRRTEQLWHAAVGAGLTRVGPPRPASRAADTIRASRLRSSGDRAAVS